MRVRELSACGLFNDSFEICERAKWVSRISVIVVKLQNRTEDEMSGHPTWNTFSLLSSIGRLLNDNTHSRVVTRNRQVLRTLKATGVAMKVTRLSHWHINKETTNPRQRAYDPNDRRVPPSVVWLSDLEDMWNKGMKQGGLSRVTVSEGLVPHIEPSCFWLTEIKITHDDAVSVRVRRPMRSDETQSFT